MSSSDLNLKVGKALQRRRRILGLTQQKLALELGISHQSIAKYESGQNQMSAARVYIMARALEVPVGYFFEGLEAIQSVH